jgi:hypothetical protein
MPKKQFMRFVKNWEHVVSTRAGIATWIKEALRKENSSE